MLASIAYIEEFTTDIDLAGYRTDHKTRFAVERQLQILTEAAFRLGDDAKVLVPNVDWRGVRGMGNRLRHGYDRISDQLVWQTIKVEWPPLKDAISAALLQIADPRPKQL